MYSEIALPGYQVYRREIGRFRYSHLC